MISRVALVLFCLIGWCAEGQILRDINFNYLYNPNKDFSFQWKIVRQADSYDVYYQLQTTDSSRALTPYTIEWEFRTSLGEKSGIAVTASPQMREERTWKQMGPGQIGRLYRPLAVVSVLGCLFLIVIGMQPPNDQALRIVGGAVVLLLVVWFGLERKRFRGPPGRRHF